MYTTTLISRDASITPIQNPPMNPTTKIMRNVKESGPLLHIKGFFSSSCVLQTSCALWNGMVTAHGAPQPTGRTTRADATGHTAPASRSSVWWTRWCCGRPWGCYCVGCGHVDCPLRVAHMLRMAHNAGCNASVPRTRGIRDHFRGTASHVCMICRSLWFVNGRILLSREQQQQPCWSKNISSSP